MSFTSPIKCYKLIKFWCLWGKARKNCPIYKTLTARWELRGASLVSMTFFLLDIMLTLSWHCRPLLGPVPWSLSTPERISTKTDKSKLQHGLQTHIELTLDWSCSAAHNIDFNAVTTEHNSYSCHLHGSNGTRIQPDTKDRACWFCHWCIYTMYKQQSIQSYKHSRRG